LSVSIPNHDVLLCDVVATCVRGAAAAQCVVAVCPRRLACHAACLHASVRVRRWRGRRCDVAWLWCPFEYAGRQCSCLDSSLLFADMVLEDVTE
jgi:hypothetical protein